MEGNISKYRNDTISNIVCFVLQYRQPLAVEGTEECLWIQQLHSENRKEDEV